MAKIYTKTGDKGKTGLIGGSRASKDDPQIEAIGAVDEVNAALGVARTYSAGDLDELLAKIQSDLFSAGALLAQPVPVEGLVQRVAALEGEIDHYEEGLEPLRNFILPGGTALAAQIHLVRTVCRRAERTVVALGSAPSVVIYLNRLSDLLFVLARTANAQSGVRDVKWTSEGTE